MYIYLHMYICIHIYLYVCICTYTVNAYKNIHYLVRTVGLRNNPLRFVLFSIELQNLFKNN